MWRAGLVALLAFCAVQACSSSDVGVPIGEGGQASGGGSGSGGSQAGGNGGSGGSGGSQAGGNGGSGGTTPPSCNVSSCVGCCMNNACQAGTTALGCGKSGEPCSACKSVQICKPDQSCGVDPTSTWLVWPSSAKITANNNGAQWDEWPDSPPDVYVIMPCGQTGDIESYTPTWTKAAGCTMKASALLSTPWFGYQLWDYDTATADEPITSLLQYHVTEDDFANGSFTVGPVGGMITMTVQLQKQ